MTISVAFLVAWLTGANYGAPQRQAVIDSAWGESRLQSDVVSRAGDAGLFQLRGPRRQALVRYALGRGRHWSDAVMQLEFMNQEWRAMPASRAFFAATTAHEARRIFCRSYERAARC